MGKLKELRNRNCEMLQNIKTPAMRIAYEAQWDQPCYENMTFDSRLNLLLTEEEQARREKRLVRNLKNSRLTRADIARVENLDWSTDRGLIRSQIESLCECEWIRSEHKPWVLIHGTSGVGKTFLAKVLTRTAIMNGFSALYIKLPDLISEIESAKDAHRIISFRKSLRSKQLLVIDEFGVCAMSEDVATELWTIIEERYEEKSLIIVGQVDVRKWHEYFADPVKADSFMDRVINQSFIISMHGPSMREKYGAIAQIEAAQGK